MKNFLNISDLNIDILREIIDPNFNYNSNLTGKNFGLIFEKYSTRTRISFKVGISQLNGNAIDLNFNELNISRDETFEDTFHTMNCYLDGIIYRTTDHQKLIKSSNFFNKPIINALSDLSHPCQTLSDLLTLKEKFGSLECHILWMGDMNNVCYSLVEAVNLIEELSLTICTPTNISRNKDWLLKSNITVTDDIKDINLKSVHCVMTDVFISMNDHEDKQKINLLKSYNVDSELMKKTSLNSVFMHCLPARVGYEVTDEVFRSSKSIVWRQAYNRMVAQKKLLQFIYQ